MNIPAGLLESLFENRDGAALTLSTARARVTITRHESDQHPDVILYALAGDTGDMIDKTHDDVTAALSHAIAALEAYAHG